MDLNIYIRIYANYTYYIILIQKYNLKRMPNSGNDFQENKGLIVSWPNDFKQLLRMAYIFPHNNHL